MRIPESQQVSPEPPDTNADNAQSPLVALYNATSPSVVQLSLQTPPNPPRPLGTAFFWTKTHLLTSAHVLHPPSQTAHLSIQTPSSPTHHRVRITHTDPTTDIALLTPDPPLPHTPPALPRRKSTPAIGEAVAIVGAPLGLAASLTAGVLSAHNRTVRPVASRALTGLLQTDASVHRGSSGAPLLDVNGRVVGVVCAVAADGQGAPGVGFAVPVAAVERALRDADGGALVRRARM